MASQSSSLSHVENQESSNIRPDENQQILHMPSFATTIASFSSSSQNELHRTLNRSEEKQFPSIENTGHQIPNIVAEEHGVTIDRPQPGEHQIDAKASEVTLACDTKPEDQKTSDKETESQEAHGIEFKECGDERTPREASGHKKVDSLSSPILVNQKDEEYIQGAKLYLVLIALTVVYFLVMLDNTILATAIPYITDEFHSLLDVGWYASAYQLISSTLQPLGGKIYSKLNSKWSFLVYLILFEIGSVVCGAAKSSAMLIGGRAIAGAGGSGLLNGALIILNSCVPPYRQPAVVGILMGLGQLGIAFGPIIGGAFTEYVTWRWCFYINLPIGAVVGLIIVLIHIPDHIKKPDARQVLRHAVMDFDLLGFILFAPAAIMFFLALQYGGHQYRWDSSQIIGLFCGAGVTFIIWLSWDIYRGDNAMVPRSMIKTRVVWASCATGFFMGGTVYLTAYYLPIYFQAVLAKSPFMSGVAVLPNILAQMIFGIISGGLVQRIGYFPPFILMGTALNAVGCGLLSLFSLYTPTGHWIGFQIIMGAGRGLTMAVPFLAMQNSLPKDMIPSAMSTLVFLQNFGAAVMVALGQTILTNSLVTLIPQYAPGVDPSLVLNAGTTSEAIYEAIGPDKLESVLLAYSMALQRVWYFTAGIAVPPFFVGWCFTWENIRRKSNEPDSHEPTEGPKQE
ncbi:major facilitator superfamily domain-containing protein [Annulohypoxylon maeteangense]|uniref:major facilitator superfamily domain-containing protein n=1 Tax=Annulohypoxylon maeteangense TaxID=1927788 RepID=UPI002008C111|nr:major facilitator superfamily domain-containing protein [Annulohypoxylon maeteangense]KAI0886808.1 major facilitator superfamily domain-containing protein [Annulohypoxylon maeteangense]